MSSPNYMELCRLCLVKERVSIPIFEGEGDVRQIFVKISSCLPVKVARDDKLPKKICDECSYKLDSTYQFWNTSANAEKQLLQWVGEASNEDRKTVPPTNTIETESLVLKEEAIEQDTSDVSKNLSRVEAVLDDERGGSDDEDTDSEEEGSDSEDMDNDMPPGKEEAESEEEEPYEPLEPTTFVNVSLAGNDEAGPSGIQQPAQAAATASATATQVAPQQQQQAAASTSSTASAPAATAAAPSASGCPSVVYPAIIPPSVVYSCGNCGMIFQQQEELDKHIRTHGPGTNLIIPRMKNIEASTDNNPTRGNMCDQVPSVKQPMLVGYLLTKSVPRNLPIGLNEDQFIHIDKAANREMHIQNKTRNFVPTSEGISVSEGQFVAISNQLSLPSNFTINVAPNQEINTSKPANQEMQINSENTKSIPAGRFINILPKPSLHAKFIANMAPNQDIHTDKANQKNQINSEISLSDHVILDSSQEIKVNSHQNLYTKDEKLFSSSIVHNTPDEIPIPLDVSVNHSTLCSVCAEELPTLNILKKHMEKHNITYCSECNAYFNTRKQLAQHRYNLHRQNQCLFCPRIFESLMDLRTHGCFESRKKQNDFARPMCKLCQINFDTVQELSNHVSTLHDNDDPLSCKECGKKFKSKSIAIKHKIRIHARVERFNCELCSKKFVFQNDFTIHMKRHQKEYSFFCHDCGEGFHRKWDLKLHKNNKHTSIQCVACDMLLSNKQSYKRHYDRYHKYNDYKCMSCNKTFDSQGRYLKHIQFHSKEKETFLCDICGKNVLSKSSLENHKRIHTGEKPYECHECKKCFLNRQRLQIHVRTHTGEKPFFCKECGKSFTQKSSLNVHTRYHTKEMPFVCAICKRRFVTRTFLKMHQKTKCKVIH